MSYVYLNIQKTRTIDYTQMIVPSTQLHLEPIQKVYKLKKKLRSLCRQLLAEDLFHISKYHNKNTISNIILTFIAPTYFVLQLLAVTVWLSNLIELEGVSVLSKKMLQ